jgi:hypothetical protein
MLRGEQGFLRFYVEAADVVGGGGRGLLGGEATEWGGFFSGDGLFEGLVYAVDLAAEVY